MDTPNPLRLGGPLNVTSCIVGGSFGRLDLHQESLGREWLKGKMVSRHWRTRAWVVVRCVIYSEIGQRFSNCPRLCKSQLGRVHCDALDDHLRGPIGHH